VKCENDPRARSAPFHRRGRFWPSGGDEGAQAAEKLPSASFFLLLLVAALALDEVDGLVLFLFSNVTWSFLALSLSLDAAVRARGGRLCEAR
jgi:hypothetical protein